MEKIACAAIDFDGFVFTLPPPARHHDVLAYILRTRPQYDAVLGETQGFWTSHDRFVEREEARKIAHEADQIIASRIGPDGVPYKFEHSQLFSEDVW